jgi:hypothetical protein
LASATCVGSDQVMLAAARLADGSSRQPGRVLELQAKPSWTWRVGVDNEVCQLRAASEAQRLQAASRGTSSGFSCCRRILMGSSALSGSSLTPSPALSTSFASTGGSSCLRWAEWSFQPRYASLRARCSLTGRPSSGGGGQPGPAAPQPNRPDRHPLPKPSHPSAPLLYH